MNRVTPVVKQLLIINVIVYVAAVYIMPGLGNLLALYYPTSSLFQPFQIITSMFMHGGWAHLLGNMLFLMTILRS